MKLPQGIRDQIYESAVTVDISENHSSTYWLDASGWLGCPLFRSEDKKSELVPTLERKGRYWKDWAQTPFCHFQGFVKGLGNLKANGSLSAVLVLEDFLGFVGDHVVVETGNISCSDRHFCFHLPGKEHVSLFDIIFSSYLMVLTNLFQQDPILWLKSLQQYLPYFKHIAIGFLAGNPRYYDCSLRGNRNCGSEYVKLCKYIHESFTNLKSAIFWIQISERDLKRTLRNSEKQEWVQAFNSFSAYKVEVEVSVIDPDAPKGLWCTCTSHNRSRIWWPTGSWELKWSRGDFEKGFEIEFPCLDG
jgi:hypothetical protein